MDIASVCNLMWNGCFLAYFEVILETAAITKTESCATSAPAIHTISNTDLHKIIESGNDTSEASYNPIRDSRNPNKSFIEFAGLRAFS